MIVLFNRGRIDANVDWCEGNYEYTTYIAELMNTLSSIPIAIYGAIGLYYCRKYQLNETRHNIAFLSLIIVGIGSTAFHATLRRWAQSLDELPMLFAAVGLFYNSLDFQSPYDKHRNIFAHRIKLKLMLILGSLAMVAIYFYIPDLFIVFFLGYSTPLAGFVLIMANSMYFSSQRSLFTALPKKLYWFAFAGYFGGFFFWLWDMFACQLLPTWVYFHAIWHIMAGLGTYFTIQTQIVWRAQFHKARVNYSTEGLLPFAEIVVQK
jgi:dihydroceramidase